MIKLLTEMRLIIFYPLNGEYDVIYATLPEEGCHWLKAYYARSHSGVRLDSSLELVVKKPRDRSLDEFVEAMREMLEGYNVADMQVVCVVTESQKRAEHREYVMRLFPNSERREIVYESMPKTINAVHFRYMEK